jgi:hypothetical protein
MIPAKSVKNSWGRICWQHRSANLGRSQIRISVAGVLALPGLGVNAGSSNRGRTAHFTAVGPPDVLLKWRGDSQAGMGSAALDHAVLLAIG